MLTTLFIIGLLVFLTTNPPWGKVFGLCFSFAVAVVYLIAYGVH